MVNIQYDNAMDAAMEIHKQNLNYEIVPSCSAWIVIDYI